jgi:hypothetical protein
LVGAGIAQAETEPNDEIMQAEGPMGAQTYTGEIQTEQDEDWYWFQLGGQQQITLQLKDLSSPGCESITHFSFRDQMGYEIEQFSPWGSGEAEYHYTTSLTGGIYYVVAYGGPGAAGCSYSFSINPSSAYATPAPALPVVGVPEPNEFKSQAYGPLMAGTEYSGALTTDNDVDQMYFYLRGHHTVEAEVTQGSCGLEYGGGMQIEITPNGEEAYDEYTEGTNTRKSFGITNEGGPKIFYMQLTGSECRWRVSLSPAESLLAALPTPKTKKLSCRAAMRTLKRRRIHLHRAERTLRFTHNKHARGRLHHKIEARKRAVRAARHRVKVACK